METDFQKVLDWESLSFSQVCNQGMLGSGDSSLLEMIDNSFLFPVPQIVDSQDFWEQQDETDYRNMQALSRPMGHPVEDLPLHSKDDFTKMLSEWQHQLEAIQDSESEDVDFNDMVQMGMRFSRTAPEGIPGDGFDVSSIDLHSLPSSRLLEEKALGFETWHDNLNSFNLENFLENDDEEEHKFGLIVAEEEGLENGEQQLVQDQNLKNVSEVVCKLEAAEETSVDLVQNEGEQCVEEAVPISLPETIEDSAKSEAEDESVDVETVMEEQIPVLEAGDLKSLLEQFEASEEFNTRSGHTLSSETSTAAVQNNSTVVSSLSSKVNRKVSSVTTQANTSLHETIRDSLPKEVIDRIKASNRRKAIPLIPAMPSKKPGRGGTRMQDAGATLSRNKLLKLVSGTGKGESVQLDHDYCSSASSAVSEVAPPKSFYHSDASEYVSEKATENQSALKGSDVSNSCKPVVDNNKVYCRLPDYYVVLAPQKTLEKNKKLLGVKEEVWDKNSRKDSGLESGEVSDASEETGTVCSSLGVGDSFSTNSNPKFLDRKICAKSVVPLTGVEKKSGCVDIKNNKFDKKCVPSIIRPVDASKMVLKDWRSCNPKCPGKTVPMVSVLKKNHIGNGRQQSLLITNNNNNCGNATPQSPRIVDEVEKKPEGPKKKKLNLDEYRSRLKELDKSRCNVTNVAIKSSDISVSNDTAEVQINSSVNAKEPKEDTAVIAESSSENTLAMETDADKSSRPLTNSVEVQTQTSPFDDSDENASNQRERRSRKRQRKCYSKRESSSSSSHSTSSSNSQRQRKSRSQRRRRTSWRQNSRGHSGSSSGSRRPRSQSNSSHSSSYSSTSSRSQSQCGYHSRSSGCHSRRSPGHGHSSQRSGYGRIYGCNSNWRSRSRSPGYRRNDWVMEREKQRQVEERRVIYVGRLDEGTSKAELRRRFEIFGPIVDISVHFRERGDNYGFVTFAYKVDAYEAVEHGNDDPKLPRYDLCFGGRRAFCKTRYADLDGIASADDRGYSRGRSNMHNRSNSQTDDFDLLLREAQAKLLKRKV